MPPPRPPPPNCFQTIVAGCEPRTQCRATAVAVCCHATAVAGLFRTVKLEAFTRRTGKKEVSRDALPAGDVTVAVAYSSLNDKDGLAVRDRGKIVRS